MGTFSCPNSTNIISFSLLVMRNFLSHFCFMYWKPLGLLCSFTSVVLVFILQILLSLTGLFMQRLSQLMTILWKYWETSLVFLLYLGHLSTQIFSEYKNQQIKDHSTFYMCHFLIYLTWPEILTLWLSWNLMQNLSLYV